MENKKIKKKKKWMLRYLISAKVFLCLTCSKSVKSPFFYLFKVSEMTYSESETNIFNYFINSLSSRSKSHDSESQYSSVFINLDICIIFTPYFHSSK